MNRVIKIGGRVQDDPGLPGTLVALAALGRGSEHEERSDSPSAGVVVVHGGGDEITALQRRLGHEPRFVGGRRSTSPAELDVVRMVLSGTANKRLVASLITAGARAVGISGEDGGTFTARVAPGAPLGRVGQDVVADATLVRDLINAGWLPVVSPVARDADGAGAGLNVNGDDAAAAMAIACRADELVFVADVDGVLVDGAVRSTLSHDDAQELIDRGVAAGGMAAKLQAGYHALEHGVARVRIAGLGALGDVARGTTLISTQTVSPWQR
ncbi:MAG TPA: acetylglutamate kinase [Gemmatimonadaceae bacterium]|nr:acetylglutamate kinase [Gemmatimonadaceae bacterium]